MRVSDLQREAQLESERLKDVDSRLAQAQKDINTKEQSLTRTQDQLTRAQTRITQETDRVSTQIHDCPYDLCMWCVVCNVHLCVCVGPGC